MPAAHMAIVKGGQDAALRMEASELNRGYGSILAVGDPIDPGCKHVPFCLVRHRVLLSETKIDGAIACSNCKVVATRAIYTTSERLSFLEVESVHTGHFEGLDWDDLDIAIDVAYHAILALFGGRADKDDLAEAMLGEGVDGVEHACGQELHITADFADSCEEDIGIQIVSKNLDLI